MIATEGFFSIYAGIDAAIGRQMVYGTARIGLHRSISDKMVELNDGKPISFLAKAISGMLSGSLAVCMGTPFDIALVRLQADSMAPMEDRRNYKHVLDVRTYFDIDSNSLVWLKIEINLISIVECFVVYVIGILSYSPSPFVDLILGINSNLKGRRNCNSL
jgi:Mitochondrial carrier protein